MDFQSRGFNSEELLWGKKEEKNKINTNCYNKQKRKRECHLTERKMIYAASYKRNTTVFEFTSTSRICSECLWKNWVTIFFKKAFSFFRLLTDVRSFELSLFWNKFLYFEDAIWIICWYNEGLLKENNKIKNCACVCVFCFCFKAQFLLTFHIFTALHICGRGDDISKMLPPIATLMKRHLDG